jgi:hypothetical protein
MPSIVAGDADIDANTMGVTSFSSILLCGQGSVSC